MASTVRKLWASIFSAATALIVAIGSVNATLEYESNAAQAANDLVIFQEDAESWTCFSPATKVYDVAAEWPPVPNTVNTVRLPAGSGCDIYWTPQQDEALMHLYMRIRMVTVVDSVEVPTNTLNAQVLYAKNPAAYQFYGSLLPQGVVVSFFIDTSQSPTVAPYVIWDLVATLHQDYRHYDGTTTVIHVWNFGPEILYLDSTFQSTVQ